MSNIDDYRITPADIADMGDAVLCNCAGGTNGVAMQADLTREIDGETATLRIYFEIRGDEEQDDESIYDVKRVISVDRID